MDTSSIKEKYEIKHLKFKYILGFIAPIAIFIGFSISNYESIMELISPTVLVVKVEQRIENNLITISIEGNGKIRTISLDDLSKGTPIVPGAYTLTFYNFDRKLKTKNFYVRKWSRNIVSLTSIINGKINVNIKNNTPLPFQGEPLSIEVTSSGNGCLWIYDIVENRTNKIFPKDDKCYYIIAGHTLNNIALIAGSDKESDSIAFLVTSRQSYDFANSIINLQLIDSPTKASINTEETNWGLSVLTYKIKKL